MKIAVIDDEKDIWIFLPVCATDILQSEVNKAR